MPDSYRLQRVFQLTNINADQNRVAPCNFQTGSQNYGLENSILGGTSNSLPDHFCDGEEISKEIVGYIRHRMYNCILLKRTTFLTCIGACSTKALRRNRIATCGVPEYWCFIV
jgi:hypothetical protein